jgi:hypothetical protein
MNPNKIDKKRKKTKEANETDKKWDFNNKVFETYITIIEDGELLKVS